jgi:hypothetical protein
MITVQLTEQEAGKLAGQTVMADAITVTLSERSMGRIREEINSAVNRLVEHYRHETGPFPPMTVRRKIETELAAACVTIHPLPGDLIVLAVDEEIEPEQIERLGEKLQNLLVRAGPIELKEPAAPDQAPAGETWRDREPLL